MNPLAPPFIPAQSPVQDRETSLYKIPQNQSPIKDRETSLYKIPQNQSPDRETSLYKIPQNRPGGIRKPKKPFWLSPEGYELYAGGILFYNDEVPSPQKW